MNDKKLTLDCSSCSKPYSQKRIPYLMECGHNICATCFKSNSNRKNRRFCKICKEKVDLDYSIKNKALLKTLNHAKELEQKITRLSKTLKTVKEENKKKTEIIKASDSEIQGYFQCHEILENKLKEERIALNLIIGQRDIKIKKQRCHDEIQSRKIQELSKQIKKMVKEHSDSKSDSDKEVQTLKNKLKNAGTQLNKSIVETSLYLQVSEQEQKGQKLKSFSCVCMQCSEGYTIDLPPVVNSCGHNVCLNCFKKIKKEHSKYFNCSKCDIRCDINESYVDNDLIALLEMLNKEYRKDVKAMRFEFEAKQIYFKKLYSKSLTTKTSIIKKKDEKISKLLKKLKEIQTAKPSSYGIKNQQKLKKKEQEIEQLKKKISTFKRIPKNAKSVKIKTLNSNIDTLNNEILLIQENNKTKRNELKEEIGYLNDELIDMEDKHLNKMNEMSLLYQEISSKLQQEKKKVAMRTSQVKTLTEKYLKLEKNSHSQSDLLITNSQDGIIISKENDYQMKINVKSLKSSSLKGMKYQMKLAVMKSKISKLYTKLKGLLNKHQLDVLFQTKDIKTLFTSATSVSQIKRKRSNSTNNSKDQCLNCVCSKERKMA